MVGCGQDGEEIDPTPQPQPGERKTLGMGMRTVSKHLKGCYVKEGFVFRVSKGRVGITGGSPWSSGLPS